MKNKDKPSKPQQRKAKAKANKQSKQSTIKQCKSHTNQIKAT